MAAKGLTALSSRWGWILRISGDALIVIIIAIVTVQFRSIVTPTRQGFSCHDPRLQLPELSKSAISNGVLYGVGFGLPAGLMILLESFLVYRAKPTSKNGLLIRMFQRSAEAIIPFFFGGAITHLSTNIPKYAIGCLRPNFFDVCKPDWTKVNCTSGGYIVENICTAEDAVVDKARVAFPSGHASLSMYFMVFLILYLQRQWTVTGCPLLRPTVQLLLFYMALYCGLTRLSDHLHHWEDVLAGDILGAAIAVIVGMKVRPDYKCHGELTKDPGTNKISARDIFPGQEQEGVHELEDEKKV